MKKPSDPVELFHQLSGAQAAGPSELHPARRHYHQIAGRILLLPRTGLVVVPYEDKTGGSWACIVVMESDDRYPVGCRLWIAEAELLTAIEVPLGKIET